MRGGDLELRPFRPEDGAAIEALLAEPEVRRWWSDGDYDRDHGWVVEVGGAVAGWVQYVGPPSLHHRPAVENERAIRSYAAVGFKPVGVLRSYERNPAGGWNDGLLMDLIVRDGKWS
jgi:aminoglycoside 6'-N-acetyltransferase